MASIWLNQKGFGNQDQNARRVINSHAAQIGRNKRREKRERAVVSNSRQKKNRDDVSLLEDAGSNQADPSPSFSQIETLTVRRLSDLHIETHVPIPTPTSAVGSHTLMACQEWVTMILPSDRLLLGLTKSETIVYGQNLLARAYEHEIFLLGLALYRLCALPLAKVRGSSPRRIIDTLRARFMDLVNQKLLEGDVDDVLIHSICCALPVDDHLGLLGYDITHLRGLEALVQLRGGFTEVGSSYALLAGTLKASILYAMATTKLNIRAEELQHRSNVVPAAFSEIEPVIGCAVPIPQGFQVLADSGHISQDMVAVIIDFQTWLSNLDSSAASTTAPWRSQIVDNLTGFEKIIFLALICLTDDLICLAQYPCMDLWRKPRPRALQVLECDPNLWSNSRYADCLLWVSTVVSLPDIEVPDDIWDQLQHRILSSRRDIATIGDVTHVLRCFFAPDNRLAMWWSRWHARLGRPW